MFISIIVTVKIMFVCIKVIVNMKNSKKVCLRYAITIA